MVIDADLHLCYLCDDYDSWKAAWGRGKRLVDLGICTEFDTVRDEYRWRSDATVDGLPVHDNPTMRAVLLEALARAESVERLTSDDA